jgi:hypothetical protein
MNLIDELIGGQWAEKTAKSLNHEVQFSNLATSQHFQSEFIELISYLSICSAWSDEDIDVWSGDFIREPKNTMDVLRTLKRSWESDKFGVIDYEY